MVYSQIIVNILVTGFTFLVLALAFHIIYITSKFFNFSIAGIISFTIYFFYFLQNQLELNIVLSISFSTFFVIALSSTIEWFIFKPLRNKATSPILLMIASLGVFIVLSNSISLIWGDNIRLIRTTEAKLGHEIYGAYITDIQLISISLCLLLIVSTLKLLSFSRIGRQILAVSSNNELAKVFGINSSQIILIAFIIGSIISSSAGILIALNTDLRPAIGFNLLIYAVVAIIIGGIGSLRGLVGGAFFLAALQHLSVYYIDSKWMDAITYLILILFLILKPLGFSGLRLKKVEI
jgi:branched-chain amino acid transport system permease protein